MKTETHKEFDFGHTKIIVLGKGLVEDNFSNVMDWFYRRRDIQLISQLGIGVPTAEAILLQKPKLKISC